MRNLTPSHRAVLGFLVAPLVPVILLVLPALLQADSTAFARLLHYAKVSYGAMLVVALPVHLLFAKLRWTSLGAYIGLGALRGLAAFMLVSAFGLSFHGPGLASSVARLLSLPVDTLGGMMILFCFWFIARPDRLE